MQTSLKTSDWAKRQREEAEISPELRELFAPVAQAMDMVKIRRTNRIADVNTAKQALHEARVRLQAARMKQ